jgi:hypothetical protein
MEPTMRNQCEATTLESTYSRAHRCLKKTAGKKRTGRRGLCPAHQSMADRAPAKTPRRKG